MSAETAVCECFRHDADDPLGLTPASVKLEQLEAIFLLYQFMVWGRTHNAKQVNVVRERIRQALGWNPAQFEACMADVLKMREGFEQATDKYVADIPSGRLIVRKH